MQLALFHGTNCLLFILGFKTFKTLQLECHGIPSILVIYSTQYKTLRNSPFSRCSMPFISTNFLPDIKHHLHHQRNRNNKTRYRDYNNKQRELVCHTLFFMPLNKQISH